MKISFAANPKATPLHFAEGDLTFLRETGKGKEIVIGIGKPAEVSRRKFIKICRKAMQTAKQYKEESISIAFENLIFPGVSRESKEDLASLAAENFVMASYEFSRFKTKKDKPVKEIAITGKFSKDIERAFKRGLMVGEMVNATRDLANTPGGDMTPTLLAEEAKKLARGNKASVRVLGRKEMEKLKMGAVLGVAKGSSNEPKFIIVEYWGAGRAKGSPIVLIGKGITFDSGGLNVKSGDGMLGMHMDMSGGAAVISATVLAAKLGLKKNVVALVPAAENSPSGESYRPGDILRAMSGKTIEVMNTDAEGRVIMADAFTYAERYKPSVVIDVATLTGAVLIALGQYASAVLSPDLKLSKELEEAGERAGDYIWPLPLWEEAEVNVRGTFGDVANISSGTFGKRYGGVIDGAVFLWQFAKNFKSWAHIDMASRMEAGPHDNLAKGATGAPVQLLIKYLEEHKT